MANLQHPLPPRMAETKSLSFFTIFTVGFVAFAAIGTALAAKADYLVTHVTGGDRWQTTGVSVLLPIHR